MNLDAPLGIDEVELPSNRVLNRLKISPEVAFYLLSRGFELPQCPPKIKTPEPSKVKGAIFSPARVDKVLRSMHVLRHTQGDFAGKPLDPLPWQVAYIFAPVFGWGDHIPYIDFDAAKAGYHLVKIETIKPATATTTKATVSIPEPASKK